MNRITVPRLRAEANKQLLSYRRNNVRAYKNEAQRAERVGLGQRVPPFVEAGTERGGQHHRQRQHHQQCHRQHRRADQQHPG